MADFILSLNAGSSSIKFAVFAVEPEGPVARFRGAVVNDGDQRRFWVRASNGEILEAHDEPSAGADLERFTGEILAWALDHLGHGSIVAVSHRFAHGGTEFSDPTALCPSVLERLDALSSLAPLHQPHNLAVARFTAASLPAARQYACFDTAFHRTMPACAQRIALPRAWEARGVRRYGFHGLSYSFLTRRLAELDPDVARKRVVFAHLGSGASLCATRDGVSVETTMSFSALDGLVMSTRCGTLDPGVVLYLIRSGVSAAEIERMLYCQSGLLGVSGTTGDMRALLASPTPAAGEAIDVFIHRLVREIGAMVAVLGGLDALVFSAGIGENAPAIRGRLADRLGWLGLSLNAGANMDGALKISSADSAVAAWVIPTDEEAVLAQSAWTLLADASAPG
ncbi:MAG TPA: acetate/propionate family kinase [Caulobacteraceae bacterium]|nr:acetate/propionate family kinase [Caulobacteraceae bacterium]